MRAFAFSVVFVLAAFSLPAITKAQALRERGEEAQIEARIAWFYGPRLQAAPAQQAAGLRALEAEKLLLQRRTPMLRNTAQPWVALGPAPMSMLNWQMGNVAGRASALAVDPRDDNRLYLGTASGGLWRSFDGGTQWTELLGASGTQSVGALAIDPNNPNRLWVGTGEKGTNCASYFGIGALISDNQGASFVARNGDGSSALKLSFINAIAVAPGNSDHVLVGGWAFCAPGTGVATNGALFRTLDGGLSWTEVLSGRINDVFFDSSNANIVYAAVGAGGYFKSIDGGLSFSPINNGITVAARMRLAQSPADPSKFYGLDSNSRLYRSDDAGANWSTLSTSACEGQCTYNLTISPDPFDAGEAILGTIRHARISAGSTLNAPMTSSWGSAQLVHQDTQLVVHSKRQPGRFWVGTDGGLWRTDNAGVSYSNLNNGLNITQFYDIAVNPNDPSKIWGGAQDNSSEVRLAVGGNPNLWNVTFVSGDGFMNLVNPDNVSNVFQTSYASGSLPALYRSLSGGAVGQFSFFATTGIQTGPFRFVTPIAISSGRDSFPAQVFVSSNQIFRTAAAAAAQWSTLNTQVFASNISVMQPVWTNAGLTLWAGSEAGSLHRCDDVRASCNWSTIPSPDAARFISDIAVDSANPNRIFVTRVAFVEPRLLRSIDGGANFVAAGLGLPSVPANSVAIDPGNSARIFVGTDVGVFVSIDSGMNFVAADSGMPLGAVVTDLETTANPPALVAATYGRGAWLLSLDPEIVFKNGFE
jgi:hypothetical protein